MRALNVPIGPKGALIEVVVAVSPPRRKALVRAGREVPPGVAVTLLVDTGASHTFIDEGVMRSLQISASGSTRYHSASTQGVSDACDVYDVSLVLGSSAGQTLWRVEPFEVMANAFINHGHQGLLGRDVLNRCQLHWRGPTRELTIGYP